MCRPCPAAVLLQVLDFSRLVHEDLSNYDPQARWYPLFRSPFGFSCGVAPDLGASRWSVAEKELTLDGPLMAFCFPPHLCRVPGQCWLMNSLTTCTRAASA